MSKDIVFLHDGNIGSPYNRTEYGTRWLALNWTCKQRQRYALKTGNDGSDGSRAAACGGPEPDRFSTRSDGSCRADAGPEPEGAGDHGGDRL